jgi:esterase/lipase
MDAARRAGNAEAVRELEAIAPYAAPGRIIPIKDIYVERKWVGYYGGVMAYRRDNSADSALAQLSPDYNDQEIRRIWDGNEFATAYLLPELVALDLTMTNKLSVPLILFEGRHDRNVNSEVAATWFDTVKAPEKHLIWFERSAHMPMTEEPGKFLLSLVRCARPIAEKADEIAP